METNTVKLDIRTYNELYDIKKAVDGKKRILFRYGYDETDASYLIAEEKDMEIAFAKENKSLLNEISRLTDELHDFRYPKKKQPSIDEIKQMTWWQFRKWKRNNK